MTVDGLLQAIFQYPLDVHQELALRGIFTAPGDPLVLAMNAPGEFPTLFAVEHRYDAAHVNRAGAAELSRIVAQRIAARLAAPAAR